MIKNDEIPADYLCPISQQIMLDPVVAGDGETYEREEIEKYLATSKQKNGKWISPVHQTEMDNQVLPNRRMKSAIQDFLSKHPHLRKEDMYFSEALVSESIAAIKNQHAKALQQLVEKEPRLWSKALDKDKTLVALVCEQGSQDLLLWLLKQIKQQNEVLESALKSLDPLLLACCRNTQMGAEGVKCWLEVLDWKGDFLCQKVKAWLETDQTELVQAVVQTQLINVNALLDSKEGHTLLHLAVQFKRPALVKWLMDNGADAKRTNTQGQRPEQLAEQCSNVELSKQIVQWRQAQKLASYIGPYTAKLENLERQNSELKKEILAEQQTLQEFNPESNDQLAQVHKALEAQQEQTFLLKKTYEEKFIMLEHQLKTPNEENQRMSQKLEKLLSPAVHEANLLKTSGFFALPPKKLTEQEQSKQNHFIELLLKGDLEQAQQMHEQGASLVAADKNGLYPLVAAAYSANPYLLKYIEEKLGKAADGFWAAVDGEQVKQKIKATTPEKRPPNATWGWIASWLLGAIDGKWWWKHKPGYKEILASTEARYWAAEEDHLLQIQCNWTIALEAKLDKHNNWTECVCQGTYTSMAYPSPEKHDEYVKTLSEQLEALEKYCLDKIAQAKKGIRLTV